MRTNAQKIAKRAVEKIHLLLWAQHATKTIGRRQDAGTAQAWVVRGPDGGHKIAWLRAYPYSNNIIRFTNRDCIHPPKKIWPFKAVVGQSFEVSVTLEEAQDKNILNTIIELAENPESETIRNPAFDAAVNRYVWSREGNRTHNKWVEDRGE